MGLIGFLKTSVGITITRCVITQKSAVVNFDVNLDILEYTHNTFFYNIYFIKYLVIIFDEA